MSSTLADRLRNETRALHVQAERSAFMSRLLRGQISRPAYVALLQNLHAIYAELEPALHRQAAPPASGAFVPLELAALARTASLERDLADFATLDATELVPDAPIAPADIEPSCRLYVEHLKVIAAGQPGLLLAHAYVRYLGDLSGGQMLRRIVARSMQLPPGVGTAFYDFGDAASTARLAANFRASLDAAAVDDDAVVGEAKAAFERHCALFDELARAHGIAA